MGVYPLVFTHKVKRYFEGLHMLYLMWWKRKVIHEVFTWLRDKYGYFDSTRERENLGGRWTTVKIR